MTVAQPWILIFLALTAVWAYSEWRRSNRRLGLAVKALTFGLIFLALSEPSLQLFERQPAVALLADGSASIPDEQRALQREFVNRATASAGDAVLRTVAFDETTRRGLPAEQEAEAEPRGTNLERAVRDGFAALPADRVPRIALVSDGHENAGSIERAIHQARQRGIPIDVIPLAGRAAPDLRLEGVTLPTQAFVGEQFPIEIALSSPNAAEATIQLSAEGKQIGSSSVRLLEGRSIVTARARLDSPGATLIRGTINAGELGELPFAGVVTLKTPRALLISSDRLGGEDHLRPSLDAAGFEVDAIASLSVSRPATFERYHVIVADNQDFEKWPLARKRQLEDFVQGGGGFLLVAGENNLYVERNEDTTDPLNRMLPATLAPPRTPEGTAVVLVLDKSSSMEGKKMQLARQSAMGVVENLRPVDAVGVLVFDNSFEWAAPLAKNEFPAQTKRLIGAVIADGGTQIAPALAEAHRVIRPQEAVYKHILLLTDGISEEGDSIQLAKVAAEEQITISTIGLGQDVNRAYLERVATMAEGRSYFLIDVSQLAQVVLRDVLEHTGSSVTEREFLPEVLEQVELLDNVALSEAGPLLGWVKFESKESAETILRVDEEDPLLVRWQYGLGRATVFTSDAKNRWAANWVEWPGFDRFWGNVARDLLPRGSEIETDISFDRSAEELIVRYSSERDAEVDPPRLFVIGPQGFRTATNLERTAQGRYEARVRIGERYGLFRVRAERDVDTFPELGYFRENTELQQYGANTELLRSIASQTGGRWNPTPEVLFATGGQAVSNSLALWPFLLGLAVLLNLIEIVARKGWLPWLGRWA